LYQVVLDKRPLNGCCALFQLNPGLAFSLVPTENFSTEPINFVAASEEIFNIWMDGINALLGKSVSNVHSSFCTHNSKWLVYVAAANVNVFIITVR